jgi:hypothetical protein
MAFSLFIYSLCFSFTHSALCVVLYVGGSEMAIWLIVLCAAQTRRCTTNSLGPTHTHCERRTKRIMGGPVLLAQYKCRPLSRRQIKLSGRYVKARAALMYIKEKNAGKMQKILLAAAVCSLSALILSFWPDACDISFVFCK